MRRRALVAALVLLLAGAGGILWLSSGASAQPRMLANGNTKTWANEWRGSTGGNYPTNGGMMGGVRNQRGVLSNAALKALIRRGEQGAKLDSANNTVGYAGSTITLVALASPHGKPNITWEIDGLVNRS